MMTGHGGMIDGMRVRLWEIVWAEEKDEGERAMANKMDEVRWCQTRNVGICQALVRLAEEKGWTLHSTAADGVRDTVLMIRNDSRVTHVAVIPGRSREFTMDNQLSIEEMISHLLKGPPVWADWEGWQREYLPPVDSVNLSDDLTVLDHGIRKWEGLRPENLERFGLKADRTDIVDTEGNAVFRLDSTTCAMCRQTGYEFGGDNDCPRCLMVRYAYAVPCEKANSAWNKFTKTGDPTVMLRLMNVAKGVVLRKRERKTTEEIAKKTEKIAVPQKRYVIGPTSGPDEVRLGLKECSGDVSVYVMDNVGKTVPGCCLVSFRHESGTIYRQPSVAGTAHGFNLDDRGRIKVAGED